MPCRQPDPAALQQRLPRDQPVAQPLLLCQCSTIRQHLPWPQCIRGCQPWRHLHFEWHMGLRVIPFTCLAHQIQGAGNAASPLDG